MPRSTDRRIDKLMDIRGSHNIFNNVSVLLETEEHKLRNALDTVHGSLKSYHRCESKYGMSNDDDPVKWALQFEALSAHLNSIELPAPSMQLAFSRRGLVRKHGYAVNELFDARRKCRDRCMDLFKEVAEAAIVREGERLLPQALLEDKEEEQLDDLFTGFDVKI